MAPSRSQSQVQSAHDFAEVVVFTGDLVGSSKLSPGELSEAMRALESASRAMEDRMGVMQPRFTEFRGDQARGSPDFSPEWEPRFSSFRGDGWQCIGPEPRFALRGALLMRARLGMLGRSFDTRVSIGIGAGRLTEELDLNFGSGPAFELSGRALDSMPYVRRFSVAWEHPPEDAALLQAIFALADEVSRKWTPAQAKVFAHLLVERERPNQEALAGVLGIRQQTVAEHLAGGGDWAIQEALKAVEG